jgi:hypothetical protein
MIAGYTACIKVYVRHLLVSEYRSRHIEPPGGGPLARRTCKKLTQAVGGASTLPERRVPSVAQFAAIMGREPRVP